jgi:hypothetical protein
MDRKEATMIAMITTTLLATILTMTSSTSAFALGHWNVDEEEEGSDKESETANTDDEERENSGDTDNLDGNEDTSQVAYEDLQACLSDSTGEGSPSEQEVQDCIDSSYGGNDGAENAPADSTDEVEESGDGVTEEVSSDNSADDEEN